MRTAAVAALLLAVLAPLTVTACKGSNGAPPPGGSSRAVDLDADDVPGLDNGIILQVEQQNRRQSEGGTCERDDDCVEPLVCEVTPGRCVVPPAVEGRVADDTPRILLDTERERPVRVYVEIADTDFERRRGLMWRTRMADNWGMLFIFDDESRRSFWMQNTYLGLDMLFIDSEGVIVSISEDARPLDTGPRYSSAGPARYVLEVNAGFARTHGIAAGQRVRLVDVEGNHEPAILQ